MTVLAAGDKSADGTLEIVDKYWDGNATMFVTISKKLESDEVVDNKLLILINLFI